MKPKKNKNSDKGGFVYSTDPDFRNSPMFEEEEESGGPVKQDLRIRVESHKGGKKATIISKFQGSESEMNELARELRVKCSTGGSVKDGEIILNGDLRPRIGDILGKLGIRFKYSGG